MPRTERRPLVELCSAEIPRFYRTRVRPHARRRTTLQPSRSSVPPVLKPQLHPPPFLAARACPFASRCRAAGGSRVFLLPLLRARPGSRKLHISSISPSSPVVPPPVEDEATAAQRAKQEAHNDRIVATFNSVMLADGLKVLKHHRRSSKKAASRVIRFVPDYGGALVWDKPLRQPGAKASRVPLDAITQVELEARIVWISAGDERVGFETSKTEDADLMYQAICILVDRCHA